MSHRPTSVALPDICPLDFPAMIQCSRDTLIIHLSPLFAPQVLYQGQLGTALKHTDDLKGEVAKCSLFLVFRAIVLFR